MKEPNINNLRKLPRPQQTPAAELFFPTGAWAPTRALNHRVICNSEMRNKKAEYKTWQTQVLKLAS